LLRAGWLAGQKRKSRQIAHEPDLGAHSSAWLARVSQKRTGHDARRQTIQQHPQSRAPRSHQFPVSIHVINLRRTLYIHIGPARV
jgi:hypothetical protein